MRKYRLIHQTHFSTDEEEERISIPVEYFDALTGLDESILKLVNEKIANIQTMYQERIRGNLRYQNELQRNIYHFNKLSPNAYSIVNMTLSEVFRALAVVETDPSRIWKQLNEAYGVDFFIQPVERQYGKRFARDYDALFEEIDKVKDEARYHINTLMTQSETEIFNLRKTID